MDNEAKLNDILVAVVKRSSIDMTYKMIQGLSRLPYIFYFLYKNFLWVKKKKISY